VVSDFRYGSIPAVSVLEVPMLGFDLETTGPDPETARIVTACVGEADPRMKKWTATGWLVNPGIPIPPEASAVHGVTDEQAAVGQEPGEAALAVALRLQSAWMVGRPVVGFNVVYDLTVLDRELRRHCDVGLVLNGPVLDGRVLDKIVDRFRRGSRKLTDVAAHYGIPWGDDAHAADADAFAAVRVAHAILRFGTWQGRPLRDLPLAELHDLQGEAYAEQTQSFYDYRERIGDPIPAAEQNVEWPVRGWVGETGA
jgi:DNA polymerase-3 subunit epsilon